jgi:GT2 family glycosyltransferase
MMMTAAAAPEVSVVVVNYNGRKWLEPCLSAAGSQSGGDAEIVLVDNGSTDGSVELVRQRFPQVRLHEAGTNLGFAAGCNTGARLARGRYIAFLNNDAVPQAGWLEALKRPFAGNTDVALTTSKIVYLHDPSVVDSAGDGYFRAGGAFKHFHGRPASDASPSREVFGACGAACMIRRETFDELNGFDEDFFMVYEDVDLSFRARLLGYRCLYVADAVVHHAGSGTLRRASWEAVYYGQRNLEWVYLKNMPTALLIRSLFGHMLYDFAACAVYASVGLLTPCLKGKWAAIAAIPAVLRKRSHVQRTRRANTSDLRRTMATAWIRDKLREKRFDLRQQDG